MLFGRVTFINGVAFVAAQIRILFPNTPN